MNARAEWSRRMAEGVVLPALLPLIDLRGELVAIEGRERDPLRDVLDMVGGADFFVRTRLRLVVVASRVQWLDED